MSIERHPCLNVIGLTSDVMHSVVTSVRDPELAKKVVTDDEFSDILRRFVEEVDELAEKIAGILPEKE